MHPKAKSVRTCPAGVEDPARKGTKAISLSKMTRNIQTPYLTLISRSVHSSLGEILCVHLSDCIRTVHVRPVRFLIRACSRLARVGSRGSLSPLSDFSRKRPISCADGLGNIVYSRYPKMSGKSLWERATNVRCSSPSIISVL